MSDFKVRRASETDAGSIAEVHVDGWRWAYRGQLPAPVLDELSVERRRSMWTESLSDEGSQLCVWVADAAGHLIGFSAVKMAGGDSRDSVELLALYLSSEEHVGKGVGAALTEAALAEARRRRMSSAHLWVLASNTRARRFYERGGWHADGSSRTERLFGVDVQELQYCLDL